MTKLCKMCIASNLQKESKYFQFFAVSHPIKDSSFLQTADRDI